MVGGVTPKRWSETSKSSSIRNSSRTKTKTSADATMIYVPPKFAGDAIIEAIEAKMELIVCITEGIRF